MNDPEEIKSDSKMWPAKLRIYEALYLFNRSVEDTLERLNELERIGLLTHEYFHEYRTQIEHTRAEANQELTDRLQDYETNESARLDRIALELEKRDQDPDDVFFSARDRRREIKQQIHDLKKALERQHTGPTIGKNTTQK
jgi:hypothetical protein